jgi:hypothetical protein
MFSYFEHRRLPSLKALSFQRAQHRLDSYKQKHAPLLGRRVRYCCGWPNCICFGPILFETSVASQNLRLLGFREEARVAACVACVQEQTCARPTGASDGDTDGIAFLTSYPQELQRRTTECMVQPLPILTNFLARMSRVRVPCACLSL